MLSSFHLVSSREITDVEIIREARSCVEHKAQIVRAPSQRIRQVRRRTQLKVRPIASTSCARLGRPLVMVETTGFPAIFFRRRESIRRCDLVKWQANDAMKASRRVSSIASIDSCNAISRTVHAKSSSREFPSRILPSLDFYLFFSRTFIVLLLTGISDYVHGSRRQ